MWKSKYESSDELESEDVLEEEENKPVAVTQYVAVKGISLDKYNARFRPGDKIPLAYLEDPDIAFDHLLNKGAIKEVGSE